MPRLAKYLDAARAYRMGQRSTDPPNNDNRAAAYWFRIAAKQGHADAQYALARLYHHGHGIVSNYQQAAYWYRQAAEQEHLRAQTALTAMARTGQTREPAYWFREPAENDTASAQYALALMYDEGRGRAVQPPGSRKVVPPSRQTRTRRRPYPLERHRGHKTISIHHARNRRPRETRRALAVLAHGHTYSGLYLCSHSFILFFRPFCPRRSL